MSAADEYRLLALTLPTRQIVKDLDVPEDMRCVLLWLEENRYGRVDEHVEDAMRAGFLHNNTLVWLTVKTRCEWLLHYVALAGPVGLPWPPRPNTWTEWVTQEALDSFDLKHDTRAYPMEHVELIVNVQTAWRNLLSLVLAKGDKQVFGEDPRDTRARLVWDAFNALKRVHVAGYSIFVPGFFRQYAFAGRSDVVLSGTLGPPYPSADALRWRKQ